MASTYSRQEGTTELEPQKHIRFQALRMNSDEITPQRGNDTCFQNNYVPELATRCTRQDNRAPGAYNDFKTIEPMVIVKFKEDMLALM
jgi:hypothetical protein